MSQAHDNSKLQTREALQLSFTGFEDFIEAFNEARRKCAAIFGDRWHLHPAAYIWARLPAAWARVKVAGRTSPRQTTDLPTILSRRTGLPPQSDPALLLSALDSPSRLPLSDEEIGERWSRAPRDQKLPVARFWPNGELPVGPEYEVSSSATLKSRAYFPSLAREAQRDQKIHQISAEQWQAMFPETMPAPAPAKPRRPSGIGLPSGRERAEADYYVEPRWLAEGLLDVEQFDGAVRDPFCGGGNIVGACLARGIPAIGSDKFDRGFGEQRDAFSIVEPVDNLFSNPPYSLIERIVRHFRPRVQRKLVLLTRLNILEGQERRELFREHPPARVWVSSRRASIPPGHLQHPRDQFGAVIPLPASGGSTAYCWIVWDHAYSGPTTLGWL